MASTDTTSSSGGAGGSRIAIRFGEGLLVSILASVVAMFIWASRRGFDLTDEGYYLQLYARPEDGPRAGSSQFHRLVDLFNGSWEPGILGYRVLGLAVLLGAAALLARGVFETLRALQPKLWGAVPSWATTTAFIGLTGLLGYSWLPLALSYNTLSATLAQATLGSTLLSLSRRTAGTALRGTGVLFELLAGISLALLVFVKWPSAALLVGLILITSVGLVGWRKALRPASVILGSFLGSLLIITVVTGRFSFADLRSGSRLAASSSHEPSALLSRYVSDVVEALVDAVTDTPWRLVALLLLLSGGVWARSSAARHGFLRWLMPMAGALYVVFEMFGAPYLERGAVHSLAVSVIVATLVVILGVSLVRRDLNPVDSSRISPATWLMASLLMLPLVVAFGTNNQIFTGSLVAAAGYGGFLVVALAVIGSRSEGLPALHHGLAIPVLGLLLAGQVLNGVVVDPYRLPTSRFEQSEPVNGVERMEGILLHAPGARFIEEVHRVVSERTAFQPGDRILAFAKLPGLVYILDGIGPGDLWINPPETGRQAADCDELAEDAENVGLTTLVLQNDEPSAELGSCLHELLPGYPESFVEVGRVAIPGAYGAGTGSGAILQILELRDQP